ncbi:hypothetical protein EON79_05315 [bacterium]|nr:MAG: hypothetical protein EON79_05315 [bacterium]
MARRRKVDPSQLAFNLFPEETEDTPALPLPAAGPAPVVPDPPRLPDVPGLDELAAAVQGWIERWLADGRPETEFADGELDSLMRRARQGASPEGPNPWRFTQALTVHATVTKARHRDETTEIFRAQATLLAGAGEDV